MSHFTDFNLPSESQGDQWQPPPAVLALPKLSLFSPHPSESTLPYLERASLSLRRAQTIVRAYSKSSQYTQPTVIFTLDLNMDDVAHLRHSFWAVHSDPIMAEDAAAAALVAIQINLVAGTLATYVGKQPILTPLIRNLLNFDVL